MGATSELKKFEANFHELIRTIEAALTNLIASNHNLNMAYFELEKRVKELESKLNN